jgi:hypothetical protein
LTANLERPPTGGLSVRPTTALPKNGFPDLVFFAVDAEFSPSSTAAEAIPVFFLGESALN